MIKMETQEDVIIKKKRSKRPKPLSCSAGGGGEEEEKDMANCLILLAQSCNQKSSSSSPEESSSVEQSQQTKASSATILEKDIYECKTCNRRFHSFQALGGHRASHKKPKPPGSSLTPPESSNLDRLREEQSTMLSLQISNRVFPCISTSNAKPRVHECSICGAEFNSGQALGGHMRRHRPIPVASCNDTKQETFATKKRRPVLCLDLNLPAPDEDEDQIDAKFPFPSKEQVIVFSASPLVDCHY